MDNDANKKATYTKMRTTTRLNYRSDCNFTAGTIVGVLDDNTIIPVVDGFKKFILGHYWYKIKIGRKHYYAVADWLKKVD